MRRGGTHFWQAPTALDLPPRGAQLKKHPPIHQLTNRRENIREKPSKPPTHSCPPGDAPPPPPRARRGG